MKKRTIWNKKSATFWRERGSTSSSSCVWRPSAAQATSVPDGIPVRGTAHQAVSAQAEVPADAARQDDGDHRGRRGRRGQEQGGDHWTDCGTDRKNRGISHSQGRGRSDLEAEPSAKKATETKTEETEPTAGQSKDGPAVTTSGTAARWSWPVEGEVAEAFSVEELTYIQAMGTGAPTAALTSPPRWGTRWPPPWMAR